MISRRSALWYTFAVSTQWSHIGHSEMSVSAQCRYHFGCMSSTLSHVWKLHPSLLPHRSSRAPSSCLAHWRLLAPLLTSQLRRPSPHANINNNTTHLFSAPLLRNTIREPHWHPQNDAQSIQLRGATRHQQTHRKQTTPCDRCARHGHVRASARRRARTAVSCGHVRWLPAQTDEYRSAIKDRLSGACRQDLCRSS
jgi:hypothetical protein